MFCLKHLYSLQDDEYKINKKGYKDKMYDIISLLRKTQNNHYTIYGHNDGDGICSIANMILVMEQLEIEYSFEIINYGDFKALKENKDHCIFVDIGANAGIKNPNAIIIDHHQREDKAEDEENEVAIDLNCNDYGIDGGVESCGSTMTYEIADLLGIKQALEIGAIGSAADMQWKKHNEFVGRNKVFNSFNLKELKTRGDKVGHALHISPNKTIDYLIDGKYAQIISYWYNEYQYTLELGIQDVYDTLEEHKEIFTCWIDSHHLGGKVNTEICHRFNKPLVSFVDNGDIKVSLRVGNSRPTHNWGQMFAWMETHKIIIEGGGHAVACGALLHEDQIDDFIHYLNDDEFIGHFLITEE